MLRLPILALTLLFVLPPADAAASGLVVSGDGFAFIVHEPSGWIGDTKLAAQFGANVVFYRRGESPNPSHGLIRVLVADKADENTVADLESDESDYQKRFPKVIFKDIDLKHSDCPAYPKLFCVPGEFYEYVTYLNPGPAVHLLLSISMNTGKKAASTDEWNT